MPSGYWWSSSRILKILTGTVAMPHGYWWSFLWMPKILMNTACIPHGHWWSSSRVQQACITGTEDLSYGYCLYSWELKIICNELEYDRCPVFILTEYPMHTNFMPHKDKNFQEKFLANLTNDSYWFPDVQFIFKIVLCGSLEWDIPENIHTPLWTTLNWVPRNFRISTKDNSSFCRIPKPADSKSWGIPDFAKLWMVFLEFRSKFTKFCGNSWISSQAHWAFTTGIPM